jgi:magnesium chelatase family protein
MDAPEVIVEVHLSGGLPAFNLVGLPDTEVKEARDRVRAAIQNCRYEFPQRRITVNLAPADLPKESGRFDLPIALGILIASGQLKAQALDDYEFAGELALGGELRSIRGALAMVAASTLQRSANKTSPRTLILPLDSAPEAALVRSATVLAARNLLEVSAHLSGQQVLTPFSVQAAVQPPDYPDLAEVKGQTQARRALEVAAAGGHSLLMSGPPGTGKSMLASRFAGILPPMSETEALEAAAVHSLAGRFRPEQWGQRPYRAPHHSASSPALVGGGGVPRPGEISLAHHGVLFLDELTEFDRRVLEALREPLETGHISIARAAQRADFPARFQLVAAMNPCPCGWLGHSNGKCRCTPDQVARYRGKLSGPLLDRIDLMIEVPSLSETELQNRASGETTACVRERVMAARKRQLDRQCKANAHLGSSEIDSHCTPDETGLNMLKQAITRLSLSARAYHRILKVARSIADLAGSTQVTSAHIAEAIHYRRNADT